MLDNTPETYNDHYRTEPSRWAGGENLDKIALEILKRHLVRGANERLMDVGCGQGRSAKVLKSYFKNMLGVDFSEEALKLAKDMNPELEFALHDINKRMPFEDNSFDIITSLGTHEHIKEPDFKEIFRLLKPTGVFLAMIPCRSDIGWIKVAPQWTYGKPKEFWFELLKRDGFKFIYRNYTALFADMFICYKDESVMESIVNKKLDMQKSYRDKYKSYTDSTTEKRWDIYDEVMAGRDQKWNLLLPCDNLFKPHKALYDAIVKISKKNIIELGCGLGDHVRNLLYMGCDVIGVDLTESLVKKSEVRNPTTKGRISCWDITKTIKPALEHPLCGRYDVAFAASVVCNIYAFDGREAGISAWNNIFDCADNVIIFDASIDIFPERKDFELVRVEFTDVSDDDLMSCIHVFRRISNESK